MRELSAQDDEKIKYEYTRQLLFNGELTGITLTAGAVEELMEIEETKIVNEVMREINKKFNLTDAELTHNTKNFRKLIGL